MLTTNWDIFSCEYENIYYYIMPISVKKLDILFTISDSGNSSTSYWQIAADLSLIKTGQRKIYDHLPIAKFLGLFSKRGFTTFLGSTFFTTKGAAATFFPTFFLGWKKHLFYCLIQSYDKNSRFTLRTRHKRSLLAICLTIIIVHEYVLVKIDHVYQYFRLPCTYFT